VSDKPIHSGEHLKKYLTNTPWYLLSSLTTKAMGFFLIPLFTYYLTPEEFGTLSTLEAFARVLPIFISLYLDSAFSRYYYEEKKVSRSRVTLLFSTHFWFVLPWGILVSLVVVLLSPALVKDLPSVAIWPVIVIVFTQLLNQLAIMVTLIWNANLLAKKLAIFQVFMSFFSVALTVYFLVVQGGNWESRIYSLGIVAVLQLSILLFIAISKGWLKLRFNLSVLKRSLKFSLPLMPNIAAGWIAMFSDRIILAHYGRLDEVGLYSVAAQIAMLMYIVNDALTKVQGPIAMSGLVSDKEEAKKKITEFLTSYLLLVSLIYFGIFTFSKELLYYFTETAYHNAYIIVSILSFCYVASGIYRVFINIISFHNATWLISLGALVQAGVNIILNFSFIPTFGMYAASFSTLMSTLAYTYWIYRHSQKLDYIRIDFMPMIKNLLLLITACIFVYFINREFSVGIISWTIKVSLFIFFIISLLMLKQSQKLRNALAISLRKLSLFRE